MSNTKLGLTNLITTSTTLKNGGGGGAPALDQTSPYTMANAQNSDRYTLWETSSSPAAPVWVDFDLGANTTVTAAAVLGIRLTGSGFTSVKVWSASAATGYPPSIPTVFTQQGQLAGDARDMGVTFASVSHRYWRFEFNHTGAPWFVGRLWLGVPTDLGLVHSPGGIYSPYRNRSEKPAPGGAPILLDIGDPGADFTLPWKTIPSSLRDTLLSLADQSGSFILIDADGNFFEVYVKRGGLKVARQSPVSFDANVELARMP